MLLVSRFVTGHPMISNLLKSPEGRNDKGENFDHRGRYAVAAIIAITIVIILNSTSPRTAFYALSVFFLFLFLVRWVIVFVWRSPADTD